MMNPAWRAGLLVKMKQQIAILISLAVLIFMSQSAGGQGTPLPSNARSLQLPVPGGQLDTNIFNTNGLVVPADVQLLIQDLKVNMSQLGPLMAVLNGENPTNGPNAQSPVNASPASAAPGQSAQNFGQNFGQNSGQNLGQNLGTLPGALPTSPAPAPDTGSNGVALVYALGAVLEDVQADLQELLPRLASMAGRTNYFNRPATMRGASTPPSKATGAQNGSSLTPVSKQPL
jgi:hypothetical protein